MNLFCVRVKLANSGRPTRPDNSSTGFCGRTAQLESGAGGTAVTCAASAPDTKQLDTKLYRKSSFTEDVASHPSGALGTNLEVVILLSWLNEDC